MIPTLFLLPLVLSGPVEPLSPLTFLGITSRPTTPGGNGSSADRMALARHLDFKATDLDAAEVVKLLGDSLPGSLRDRFKGRIGKVLVEVRGDTVTMKAEKLRLIGDWVTRAEGTADLKTRKYQLKLYAFGGLVEIGGVLPAE